MHQNAHARPKKPSDVNQQSTNNPRSSSSGRDAMSSVTCATLSDASSPPAARAVDEACVLVWGTQDEATPACEAGARAAAAVREAAEGGWGVGVGGRLFRG